ncbi:MAG: hypothetical protein ACJAVV_003898 [Alphaproteobacteria bacterium]|jgi:hypothetical protein
MKWLTLIIIPLTFNAFADIKNLIKDDPAVCHAIESGSFTRMQEALIDKYSLKVEQAYLNIVCDDNDIMGMIVDAPTNRLETAKNMSRYFRKKLGKPELFSYALLSRIDGKDILRRIDITSERVSSNVDLAGTEYEEGLIYMQNRYLKWLQKYPVPGSVEVVKEHKKYLDNK